MRRFWIGVSKTVMSGAAIVLLLANGCADLGPRESPVKTEEAVVLQLAYVPGTSGMGVGFTGGGDMHVTSTSTDAVWAVVLRCKEHGATFSVRGKEYYDHATAGATVTVRYVEILERGGEDRPWTVIGYRTVGLK